jgi:1,2-diacylglycerol 3-beta-glucosyltransferase
VIVVTLVGLLVAPHQMWELLSSRGLTSLFMWYLLTFGVVPLYAVAYWLKEPNYSLPRAIALGHLFSLYAYLWFIAGWIAVARLVFKRRSWAKTARTPERMFSG